MGSTLNFTVSFINHTACITIRIDSPIHPGNWAPLRNCFRPTTRRDALSFRLSMQEEAPINHPPMSPSSPSPLPPSLASHDDDVAPLIFARGDEIILGLSSVNAATEADVSHSGREREG